MARTKAHAKKGVPHHLSTHPNERLRNQFKRPAHGYVFVPKGDVYITRHCRDFTIQSGSLLYIVYHQFTKERLGLDCPEQIYEAVQADAEASAEKRQHAVAVKDERERAESQAVLQELFPHMLDSSLKTILDHGFQKGSGRVGRVAKLDDIVKANLAVNAHIRHNHTAYDTLYSTMKAANDSQDMKVRARTVVYDQVKKIAECWRTGRLTDDGSIEVEPTTEIENGNLDATRILDDLDDQLAATSSGALDTMEDLNNSIERLNFAENQSTGVLPITVSRRSARSVTKATGSNHHKLFNKVSFGGVQKSQKLKPENPTRIQPKRGMAALDEALANMVLDETSIAERPSSSLKVSKKRNRKHSQSEAQHVQQEKPNSADIGTTIQSQALGLADHSAASYPSRKVVQKLEKKKARDLDQKQNLYESLERFRANNGDGKGLSANKLSRILSLKDTNLTSQEIQRIRELRDKRMERTKARADRKKKKLKARREGGDQK